MSTWLVKTEWFRKITFSQIILEELLDTENFKSKTSWKTFRFTFISSITTHWLSGSLVYWLTGFLAHWSFGSMVLLFTGLLYQWSSGHGSVPLMTASTFDRKTTAYFFWHVAAEDILFHRKSYHSDPCCFHNFCLQQTPRFFCHFLVFHLSHLSWMNQTELWSNSHWSHCFTPSASSKTLLRRQQNIDAQISVKLVQTIKIWIVFTYFKLSKFFCLNWNKPNFFV